MNPERLPYKSRSQSANRILNGGYRKSYVEIIFKIKSKIEAELAASDKETLNTFVMSSQAALRHSINLKTVKS